MSKFFKLCASLLVVIFSVMVLSSCEKQGGNNTEVVEELTQKSSETTNISLNVYNTETKQTESVLIDDYLCGVLAGEIYNNWPLEALKAQAILARTYTYKFIEDGGSKYSGADISTDITEAQAYNTELINDSIRRAVNETSGKVVKNNGELINAWFHSNSGGKTVDAKVGLDYAEEEPDYIISADSPETSETSENFTWTTTLTKSKVLSTLREMGVSVSSISNFALGDKDESGRVKEFIIGDTKVSAPTFRLKVGSTDLKSTLIDKIVVSSSSIYFEGRGYGHGVGMSQWGAKVLADQGKNAEEIIKHYFHNVNIESLTR